MLDHYEIIIELDAVVVFTWFVNVIENDSCSNHKPVDYFNTSWLCEAHAVIAKNFLEVY